MTPRIEPRPRDSWDEEAVEAIRTSVPKKQAEAIIGGEMPVPTSLGQFVHHPRLAQRWLRFSGVFLSHPKLGERLRELIVLRVAWLTRSRYEWVQHVHYASFNGVTTEEIDALGPGGPAAWTPLEAAALAATDQLVAGYDIDDATWSALSDHLDEAGLVELIFCVGSYVALAMAFNAMRTPLDENVARTPAPEFP